MISQHYLADPSDQAPTDSQLQPQSSSNRQSSSHPHDPFSNLSNMSGSGLMRSTTSNVSPTKSRVGSAGDLARAGSPAGSPSKRAPAPRERKGSIWDSLFQVDVTYQKSRK